MARSHGRVKVEIWSDPEWRALTMNAQRAYLMLLSQAQINNCGIIPFTPRKWAKYAVDQTMAGLEQALAELHGHRFVLIDDETEELLVRTFFHHDRIEGQPNLKKAAQREYLMVESPRLRQVLADQYPDVFTEGVPEGVPELLYEGVTEGVSPTCAGAPPAPSPTPPPLERADSVPSEESVRLSLSREEQAAGNDASAPLALAGSRSAEATPDKKRKTTGWTWSRGSHGEQWKRDPEGTDKPPSEVVQSWKGREERAEAPHDNGLPEEGIDLNGLQRIRQITAEAGAAAFEDAQDERIALEQQAAAELASPEAEARRRASLAALERIRAEEANE